MIWLSAFLFGLGLFLLASVFFLYPFWLWLVTQWKADSPPFASPKYRPRISMVVVARNARALVDAKLDNFNALDYPQERLELVFFSDGSTDGTPGLVAMRNDPRILVMGSEEHVGKFEGLNRAVGRCTGDLVIFSDADALIEPGALLAMARHFADPDVGGVCGQRVIQKEGKGLEQAQQGYIGFDSLIKRLESGLMSITSNDGKLYAIRREMHVPVPGGVTDDLFTALAVIAQGGRFVFEPEARAAIRTPSRNPAHEITRRRRIVSRGLRGIWLNRVVLNPFRFGLFSFGLLVNKVFRRLLPWALAALFLGNLGLALFHPGAWGWLLAPQILGYLLAIAHPLLFASTAERGFAAKLTGKAWYFLLGMVGTHFGVLDFLAGRIQDKWDPVKSG